MSPSYRLDLSIEWEVFDRFFLPFVSLLISYFKSFVPFSSHIFASVGKLWSTFFSSTIFKFWDQWHQRPKCQCQGAFKALVLYAFLTKVLACLVYVTPLSISVFLWFFWLVLCRCASLFSKCNNLSCLESRHWAWHKVWCSLLVVCDLKWFPSI